MWNTRDAMGRGGLMTYSANRADLHRRAATFVDRILKGDNPAEIPIERPSVFDLVINLRTATAIGLKIPDAVVSQATELIL